MTQLTTGDRIAMALSSGLMLLGIVGLGIVEILAGKPYGASPVEITNDAGEVVNTIYPAVDPAIRTGLVIAGLVVLAAWGGYQLLTPESVREGAATHDASAD